MRDLAFVGFLATLLAMALKRPFLFVLAYAYVDIVAPQGSPSPAGSSPTTSGISR